ncbi:MAG TPA: DUF5683 domain-containing protein [Flavobacteriaceae bacterium]|nr:DUF5683 domain-containing protein [Flavobacteriaceae bacterium]
MSKIVIFFTLLLTTTLVSIAQESDSLRVKGNSKNFAEEYNPLAPATAAFYSAVLPGLGQAYNKRYWKIPLVYAGIGAGIYYHLENKKDYKRFRDIYKRRLEGYTDDEYYGDGDTPKVSNQRLRDAQRTAQRNKDLSIAVAIGFYLINIIDANVDAHLKQFNISEDLSLQPRIGIDPVQFHSTYTLSLNFKL